MFDYQKLKQDVVAALTGATAAGTNVSKDNIFPDEFDNLPAIAIYTVTTAAASDTHIGVGFQAGVSLIISIIVSSSSDYIKIIDEINQRIKVRLFSETYNDWATDNDITEVQGYTLDIIMNPEASRETVTGEFTISLLVCERF